MTLFKEWNINLGFFVSVNLVVGSAVLAYVLNVTGQADAEAGVGEETEELAMASETQSPELPYRMEHPSKTHTLPNGLREISGLVVNPAGGIGWAINDEQGVVFEVDLSSGLVKSNLNFSKAGDYEAIERIDDSLVVARSDGVLYRIQGKKVVEIESPLGKEADVEGLAHDPKNKRLLVACKGRISKKKKHRKSRGVYAVSLPDFNWDEDPLFLITEGDIEDFLDEYPVPGIDIDQATSFAPSAIAVHPKTGEIYLLSTRARLLVVVDGYGEIIAMAGLSRKVHRQPEGLSFDSKATLYVSNEGRNGTATIHHFEPIEVN